MRYILLFRLNFATIQINSPIKFIIPFLRQYVTTSTPQPKEALSTNPSAKAPLHDITSAETVEIGVPIKICKHLRVLLNKIIMNVIMVLILLTNYGYPWRYFYLN